MWCVCGVCRYVCVCGGGGAVCGVRICVCVWGGAVCGVCRYVCVCGGGVQCVVYVVCVVCGILQNLHIHIHVIHQHTQ